jgi:hypothetical protein
MITSTGPAITVPARSGGTESEFGVTSPDPGQLSCGGWADDRNRVDDRAIETLTPS